MTQYQENGYTKLEAFRENGYVVLDMYPVSYTHLTLPTNREV